MGEFNFQAWTQLRCSNYRLSFQGRGNRKVCVCVLSNYCAPGPMLEHPPPSRAHSQVDGLEARPQRPGLHPTGAQSRVRLCLL